MKALFLASLLALLILGPAFVARSHTGLQAAAGQRQVSNEPLRQELREMQVRAQEVHRRALAAKFRDEVANEEMDAVDLSNTARLREIINVYGWPTLEAVGLDGVQAAFLVVVQSPTLEFQQKLLPTIKEAAEHGQLALKAYAALVDRVRLKEGKPQVYGTQAQFVGGEVVIGPIEEAEGVDERRRGVGLPTLAEYKKELEKAYRASKEGVK